MLYIDLLAGIAVGILALECLLRLACKYAPGDSTHGFRAAMLDVSHQLELFSLTEPHPFLQYTLPRTPLMEGDQEYGFRGIRLSDVPKPARVVRIACIGGCGADGDYSEFLQEYLDQAVPASRFQVLDFAVDGWASVHSMLNFILNVREFHPDMVVIHDELRGAICSGYPCSCLGREHDHAPLPFRDNPVDEWMLGKSWIYRACRVILARSHKEPFDIDVPDLQQYRQNVETICTLAASDGIKVILLTSPCASDDSSLRNPTRAVNEITRDITKERGIALVDLENLPDANDTANQIKAERIGNLIIAMHSGSDAQ